MNTQKMKHISEILDKIEKYENVNISRALKTTNRKILKYNIINASLKVSRYAAFFIIPILIFYILTLKDNRPHENTQIVEVITAPGTIVKYTLPDSTEVWLNSGSKLSHPSRFNNLKREVKLNGEAFFKVKSSESNPFLVHTAYNVSTYVYGTEFNIDAYAEDKRMRVSLISGKLDLIDQFNRKTHLPKGYKALLEGNKIQILKTNLNEDSEWRNGVLIFNSAPLDDIITKLERFYNVDIHLKSASGSELNKYSLRSIFTHETIEQILDYLSEVIDCKWSYDGLNNATSKKQINIVLK